MSKSQYAQLEADLIRYAYDLGLMPLPYPPRFHGVCGALRPKGFVILPNGDIHKCWDTVSMPDRKTGSNFNIEALRADERVLKWIFSGQVAFSNSLHGIGVPVLIDRTTHQSSDVQCDARR